MARAPEDRYPSALALAEDVERWLGDEPVLALREPPAARLARWGRRHQSRAFAAAAGLLLLASTVAALSYRQKVAVVAARATARAEGGRGPARRPSGPRPAASRRGGRAPGRGSGTTTPGSTGPARPGPRPGPAGPPPRLAELAAAARLDDGSGEPEALRDEAIAALSAVDLRRGRATRPGDRVGAGPDHRRQPRRPAGRRLPPPAPGCGCDYAGRVLDLATGRPTRDDPTSAPGSPGLRQRWRRSTTPRSRPTAGSWPWPPRAAWSTSGTSTAPTRSPSSWAAHEQPVHSVTFSADGRSLYSASEDGTLRRWRLGDDPTPARPVEAASAPIAPVARAWRLGGVARGPRRPGPVARLARPRDAPARLGRSTSARSPRAIEHACPSPDGRSVAFVAGGVRRPAPDRRRPAPDARAAAGSRPDPTGVHFALRFSPDGSLLMAAYHGYRGRTAGREALGGRVGPAGLRAAGPRDRAGGRGVHARRPPPPGGGGPQARRARGRRPRRPAPAGPRHRPDPGDRRRPRRLDPGHPGPRPAGRPGAGRGRPLEAPRRAPGRPTGPAPTPRARRPGRPASRWPSTPPAAGWPWAPAARRSTSGTSPTPAEPWATVETGGIHPVVAFAGGGRRLWGIMGRKGSDDRVVVVDPDRPVGRGPLGRRPFEGPDRPARAERPRRRRAAWPLVAAHDGDVYLFRDGDPPGTPPITWPGGGPVTARDPAHAVALAPDGSRAADRDPVRPAGPPARPRRPPRPDPRRPPRPDHRPGLRPRRPDPRHRRRRPGPSGSGRPTAATSGPSPPCPSPTPPSSPSPSAPTATASTPSSKASTPSGPGTSRRLRDRLAAMGLHW